MRWWIQTRSESTDYRFIGNEVQPDWWWDRYLRFSAPENRTLVVETDSGEWRFYATAMDSGRNDGAAPPRAIRNSLLVHGASADEAVAAGLVEAYFDGTLESELRALLQHAALDRAVSVGRLGEAVENGLDALLAKLSSEAQPELRTGTWLASITSRTAHGSMASAVRAALSAGQVGLFGYLNLMSDADEGNSLVRERGGSVGMFLVEDAPDQVREYRRAEAATPANPPKAGSTPRASQPGRSWALRPMILWVLAGLVLLGVVAMVLVLIGRTAVSGW